MKNRRLSLTLLGSSLIVFTASAQAGDVIKANNTVALNVAGAPPTGSWVAGVVPTSTDVAVWDSTVTAPNVCVLGGDLSWQGIKITNVAGSANPSATTAGIQITNASSANTLTLGTAGIDMPAIAPAATQAMQIQSKITLDGNQTWKIANANTNGNPFGGTINAGASEDLLFVAQVTSTAMNLGGYTLDTSGAGTIVITNGYTLSNGTLNFGNTNTWIQSGSSRATALLSTLAVNVGTNANLRLRSNSGGVSSASAIGVSGTGAKLQLEINNSGVTMAQSGALTFGTGTTFENILSTSGAMTIGAIATSGSVAWNVNGGGSTGVGHANGIAVSGNLTGNGTITYANTASASNGQVRLSADNSGFNGTFNINGSSGNRSLRLTSATAGSSTATWAPAANNILQVDGVAVNFGTLNGAGTVTNSHATNTAAISVGAGAFSGVISNGTPTDGMALTKIGSGTLALTGANSYTGLTDIQGGTLTTTSGQTGGGAVTVADSATFGVAQLNNGDTFNVTTLTMGSTGGSTLELTPAAAPSAALVTAGTFTVNGPTTLRVKGLPVAGTTLVSSTSASGLGSLSLAMPFRINGTLDISSGTSVVLATVQDETPKWRNGDGVWDINTTGNWKTSTTATTTNYLEGGVGATDSVIFDDTSSGTSPITVTLNSTVSPVAITVAGTKGYIVTGTGTIAGTAGISKSGTSALTLATANTFSGGVLLNEGTLNVNNATALGSGTLTIAGGTILNNTSGSPVVANNAQIWDGDFTFTGSNDLTLGGAVMSNSTVVTVSAGTLSVGGIAGSGLDLIKEGAGTLALSGTSTYSGATLINNGVLRATAANAISASSSYVFLADVAGVVLDLNGFNQTVKDLQGGGATGGNVILGGGILTANTTSDSTFAGALSGAGGLTKTGSAILTLSGDKSGYTGATNVSDGTLDVGTLSGTFGTGDIVVSDGDFFQANGSLTQKVTGGGISARGGQLTVNIGGAGAVVQFNSAGTFGLGRFKFGSSTADGLLLIQNPLDINNYTGGRTLVVNSGVGGDSAEFAGAITAPISDPANRGIGSITKDGTGLMTLSGANTYLGNTVVNAGSLTLADGGQLKFKPAANSNSNKIYDASPDTITPALNPVNLDGDFVIDLSTAAVAAGNTWTLVDVASVNAVHGASFSVVGFDDSDLNNVWTMADSYANRWSYTEATGVLSVVPSAYTLWITSTSVSANQRGPQADPDGDGLSNLEEYAIAGSDPAVANGSLGTFSGGVLSFSKRQPADSDLTYQIEESDDLGISDPWAGVTPDVNDGTTIAYTLPIAGPKLFARLKVTLAVP